MGNRNDQTAWDTACRREREAWRRAFEDPPGSPDYDTEAWALWRDSVERANEAMYLAFGIPARHPAPEA
jgi:hypothetical protein